MSVKFKVGDRVRLVSINREHTDADTVEVLERLMKRRRVVKVDEIQAGNIPWVTFRLKNKTTGRFDHHFVSMYFDIWEKVD